MDPRAEAKRPAPLSIDLNEIPPPPSSCETPTAEAAAAAAAAAAARSSPLDAYALACSYHAAVAPAAGLPEEFPGEAGVGAPPQPCALCGLPEVQGLPWCATVASAGSTSFASANRGRRAAPRTGSARPARPAGRPQSGGASARRGCWTSTPCPSAKGTATRSSLVAGTAAVTGISKLIYS
uniref:Uncharacterized protein n=1 Tax=Ananas comosus var. bracteatus TaxID=296719 RepID=A0A6V7PLL2_ANACO|nr:unnamed protein product [Ananas comosus var. bracteatus]